MKRLAGLLGLALLLAWPMAARADDADDAVAATIDLYARLSARDAAVLRYVPADGFDELGPGSVEWHRLDASAFQRLFGSNLRIALRAEDVRARMLGDTAVVTGTRVGSVAPADQRVEEARHPFTLVWTRSGDRWQLQHVHLSAAASPPKAAP